MKNDTVITLSHVSKKYIIHHEKPILIEELIKDVNESFYALKNINLKIKKGEKVGIIGRNGSGKTTLLKIICGITKQTEGTVETKGKIVSIIDLEAGFHPDLSGLQNIYINGMLLGMTKGEISAKLGHIIDFADIRQFIDTPVYTYSEGMKLRLGFSVVVHTDPDILVLDENIGVGDKNFRVKSQRVIENMIKKDKTFILVSHELEFIRMYCNRVIVIDQGKIIKDGGKSLVDCYRKGMI